MPDEHPEGGRDGDVESGKAVEEAAAQHIRPEEAPQRTCRRRENPETPSLFTLLPHEQIREGRDLRHVRRDVRERVMMQVALKDLEIRGAGNLLGGEQSGHIADVGFDLYMRMVGEAVIDFKSDYVVTDEISHECKIEIPVDAHLPEEYVDSERLRLDIYRRLADVKDPADIKPIEDELIDRFGALPAQVSLLLQVATLRASARKLGIQEVIQQGKNLKISPIKLPESKQLKLQRLYPGSLYKGGTNVALVALPAQQWSPLGEKAQLRDTSVIAWATSVIQELTSKN